MLSHTEENYLKAIYKLEEHSLKTTSTNTIAAAMDTSAASVTDMLKRLAEKTLIDYEKYRGVRLTNLGYNKAKVLVRKHRLWEVFLVEKLYFSWDEVHEIAEELEHIKSEELVARLDKFLHYPKFDPHGDPIPDADGNVAYREQVLLSDMEIGVPAIVVGVNEHTPAFLQYLNKLELTIGTDVKILEKMEYDDSLRVLKIKEDKEQILTSKVSRHVFVKSI